MWPVLRKSRAEVDRSCSPRGHRPMPLVEIQGDPEPRRNLVIVRAGDDSEHERWGRDVADEARNWNLLVSFFGRDPERLQPPFEYLACAKGQKWPALAQLFDSGELPPFDYVWCVDDDIGFSWPSRGWTARPTPPIRSPSPSPASCCATPRSSR